VAFAEWASELIGTFVLLYAVYMVVAAFASPLSPLSEVVPAGPRLVLIGLAVGLISAAAAVSLLGRRSAAHLNPAVTVGFWSHGQTYWHDLLGYIPARFTGAALASVVFHRVAAGRKLVTAKLFHDPAYPSVHASRWHRSGIPSGGTMNG
jgi:aquaporin Z